jgi:hypothetical protein
MYIFIYYKLHMMYIPFIFLMYLEHYIAYAKYIYGKRIHTWISFNIRNIFAPIYICEGTLAKGLY